MFQHHVGFFAQGDLRLHTSASFEKPNDGRPQAVFKHRLEGLRLEFLVVESHPFQPNVAS